MARTVVAFGNFDLEGGRSWAIRKGFAEHGYMVELCRTEAKGIVAKYRELRKNWRKVSRIADAIYVPFLGHWILPLAWVLGRKRGIPVIFDAFLSLYDTEVCDRGRIAGWSPRGLFLWFTDWLCCRLCDLVLIDTDEHRDYFIRRYGVRKDKILALPIGCRSDLFVPRESTAKREVFTVEFHGTFIPLQGIDVILRAARALEERREPAKFVIIGKGQTTQEMRQLAGTLGLTTVEFIGPVPMERLPEYIAAADVCLGIFGTTDKASRVIPNKAYEILSCGKPLVTARSWPAIRMLHDRTDCLLTAPGDAEDLADKLLELKRSIELRKTLGQNGRRLSLERFQPRAIVSPLADWLRAHPHG